MGKRPGRGIWLTLDRGILDYVGSAGELKTQIYLLMKIEIFGSRRKARFPCCISILATYTLFFNTSLSGLYKQLSYQTTFPKELPTLVRYQLEKRVLQEATLMRTRIVTQPSTRFRKSSEVRESQNEGQGRAETQNDSKSSLQTQETSLQGNGGGGGEDELIQTFKEEEVRHILNSESPLQENFSAWLDFRSNSNFSSDSNDSSLDTTSDSTSSSSSRLALPTLTHYPLSNLLSPNNSEELKVILLSSQIRSRNLTQEQRDEILKNEEIFSVGQDELTVGLVIALYRLRVWKRSEIGI